MDDEEKCFREQNTEISRVVGRIRERHTEEAKHHVMPVHRGKARK